MAARGARAAAGDAGDRIPPPRVARFLYAGSWRVQRGLNEIGFVDGQNLAIEYRWAGNEYAQFPSLAADLVRRQVNVVAVLGNTG